jgi:signal transduction histidine kinase
MKIPDSDALDLYIARARITLSLVALTSIYIDPSIGGIFHLDSYLLATLLGHLLYSVAIYIALIRGLDPRVRHAVSLTMDVLFAAAVTFLTEGATSPSYVYFVFAIVATGFRTGFSATLALTCGCVGLYLVVIALLHQLSGFFVMRAVYLAIAGYFIGFFGQQRAKFEGRVRELEAAAERHTIARSLHDGYVQALAGVTLRLGTCLELLARGRVDGARDELAELRMGVAREYDQIRSYIASLAHLDEKRASSAAQSSPETTFSIEATFSAGQRVVEQVVQVMLEAIRNTARHASARSATIHVSGTYGGIRIVIDDDGVGFSNPQVEPWSIASRVAECGGQIKMGSRDRPGAHLEIEMPVR